MIVVDLKSRVISKDQEVYVARPGRAFRLYREFIENEIVAPDLPFLELKPDLLAAEHKDLDQRIRRSRAIRAWYRGGKDGDGPSRDLRSYAEAKSDKRIHSLRTVVLGFFDKLRLGDLVVVPPSAYSGLAYIGEVVSPSSEHLRIKAHVYDDDPITGRRVRWLGHIEKRKLPDTILDALEHPTSIYLLARNVRGPIYEAAFKSFIDLSGKAPDFTARFNVTTETYTTSSDFLLQAFFNLVASNQKAIDSGKKIKTVHEAAFDNLEAYAVELRTNVNSPGHLTLASAFATPLIASALFALATQIGPEAAKALAEDKVRIGNSLAPKDDPCTASVIKGTMTQLRLLGLTDAWVRACEIAKAAADKSGVTGTVTIEQKP